MNPSAAAQVHAASSSELPTPRRITPGTTGTKLVFKNEFFGPVPEEFREGMPEGWGQMLEALKRDVER